MFGKPFTEPSENLASLFRTWTYSCSDSPNRFISQNYITPIINNIFNSIKLLLYNIDSLIRFSLLQSLPKTVNNFESSLKSICNFVFKVLISFFEMCSSFGMANQSPFNIHISELFRSNLSSISSTCKLRTILCSNFDIFILFGELDSNKM